MIKFLRISIKALISSLAADSIPPVVPMPKGLAVGEADGLGLGLGDGDALAEADGLGEGEGEASGAGLASDFLPMSDLAAAETTAPPCFSLATQETYWP